jgi:hypothetical protein
MCISLCFHSRRWGHRHRCLLANIVRDHATILLDDATPKLGRDFRKGHEGYNSIPSLAVVFNLCDRRFDTRSGRMTWHPMKK